MGHLESLWIWYTTTLNSRPIITTFISGLLIYSLAIVSSAAALVMLDDGWLYSFVCLIVASLVLAYHWSMSRYQDVSTFAQFLHLSLALFFMWFALALPIRISLMMD